MIAWCGSRREGLGWLHDRCCASDEVVAKSTSDKSTIEDVCALRPRRLVLSIDSRIDYPIQAIEYLAQSWPEIPWAVATSSWHDGARRTGIGATAHLTLPWYRWWDGWFQWLVGNESQLLGPWPRLASALSHASSAPATISSNGVIVSNCRETAMGWKHSLLTSLDTANPASRNSKSLSEKGSDPLRRGQNPNRNDSPPKGQTPFRTGSNNATGNIAQQLPLLLSTTQLATWLTSPTFEPAWWLWDDTCLDTFDLGQHFVASGEHFSQLKTLFPKALLVAATGMPRWTDWLAWNAAGVNELIVKPSMGLPLVAVLGEFGFGNE